MAKLIESLRVVDATLAFTITSSSSSSISCGGGSCEVNLSRSRVSIRRSGVIAVRPVRDQCLAVFPSRPRAGRFGNCAAGGDVECAMQWSGVATWTVFWSAPDSFSRYPTRRAASRRL